jgi:phosphatidylserine/phosphatidylglycerophosphate/cardiolipin synthase-like enzyme
LAAFVGCFLVGTGSLAAAGPALGTIPPPPSPAAFFPSEDAAEGPILTRVYANGPRDDEFVEIGNAGPADVDLTGWALSDGEATARFPLGAVLPGAGRIVATRNATSYAEDLLEVADFTWDRGVARRLEGGVIRLADAGDEVLLLDPAGRIADLFAYGDSAYAGPGWSGPVAAPLGRGEVATRAYEAGFWTDSDGRADWDGLRAHRLGQSSFDLVSASVPRAVYPFTAPESTREALVALLGSARSSVDVAVYTLTDEGIAGLLARAARSGVRVRVLLDGSPVGGVDDDAHRLAGTLAASGAEVRWLDAGPDAVKRYRYLHAKYAIVDVRIAWIGSENFGPSGFPVAGQAGNRGWAVAIDDPVIAGRLTRVFDEDFDPRRRDSVAAEAVAGAIAPPVPPFAAWPISRPSRAVDGTLVIVPDAALHEAALLGLLDSARSRLWIELFYLEETWGDMPNPFLEAALRAARRGVAVRILLDGSWWNDDPDAEGNDDVAARLRDLAVREGIPLEARLVEPRGSIERVHNKGVLVDDRAVFVGSMNWAHGSATENREVGVIVQGADVATAFAVSLEADWGLAHDGGFEIEDPAVLAVLYGGVAAASAASLRILRGGPKGLKPPGGMGTRARLRDVLRGRRGEVRLLPPDVVAEPEPRPRGRRRTRGRGGKARGDRGGPEGN